MTNDFSQPEKELAQWFVNTLAKNYPYVQWEDLDNEQQFVWLLTARELQKKWTDEIDYYQNYAESHPSLTHEQRYKISCIFDKLKSHFLKGEDK